MWELLMMKKYIIMMVALLTIPMGMAGITPDDDDKDPSIQQGIRRLHPERERAKAIKKLQEQRARKADPNADPWDTSDEVWGTVDVVPTAVADSGAVAGHRVTATSKTASEQALVDDLINTDYSIREYGVGLRRMTWHDEPVTRTIDELLPVVTIDDAGDCLSKYVTRSLTSNEVYFAFAFQDSVAGPLRLCVHYCADDPLNYDQLTFNIDGYDYMFYPDNPRRGVAGDLYWEQSDDVLRPGYKDLVYALAHSHWVVLKLVGESGINHVKMLTSGQRDDFANTLALYRLLGGTF